MDVLTASLRSTCSLRSRHFVNSLRRYVTAFVFVSIICGENQHV
ncbi:gluconate 5-dehydrogenase [Yersinia enterocolitica]|nr:gluconate 5-dehydrogenase [Yersinia enterocolitica]